jgi:exonuclease III
MTAASPQISRSRIQESWAYLASLEPDIVFLQESLDPRGYFNGYYFSWRRAYEKGNWGSAVLARGVLEDYDLSSLEPELRPLLETYQGQNVAAKINASGMTGLVLASIHTPARKVRRESIPDTILPSIALKLNRSVWRADVLFGALRRLPEISPRFMVGGDWNTSRGFDVKYGPRGNQEFFDRMADSGLIECFRLVSDSEIRTWYKKNNFGYQLDHVFCDRESAGMLKTARVDPTPAESGLSDHAALILEFDIP